MASLVFSLIYVVISDGLSLHGRVIVLSLEFLRKVSLPNHPRYRYLASYVAGLEGGGGT